LAAAPNLQSLNCYNLVADCSILLKYGTELNWCIMDHWCIMGIVIKAQSTCSVLSNALWLTLSH